LKIYTKSERLGRVYNCENCRINQNYGRTRRQSVRTEADKRITVLESPKCLFVHLKRAKYRFAFCYGLFRNSLSKQTGSTTGFLNADLDQGCPFGFSDSRVFGSGSGKPESARNLVGQAVIFLSEMSEISGIRVPE
jgi:hypothetical protein